MAYTDEEIKWVYDRTDGRCLYCGTHLELGSYGMIAERGDWEINYFIPKLNNGERRKENWVPACTACDTVKGECFPWEYDARRFLPEDENPDNYIKRDRSLPIERDCTMSSKACDLKKLTARELLVRYRKQLPPGAYYFIGKGEDARPEDIIEIFVPFSGHSNKSRHEAVFAFFEKGCPPPNLHKKDLTHWLHQYPFSHNITSTSGEFQEKLASFVRARLLNVHEHAGTKMADDQ